MKALKCFFLLLCFLTLDGLVAQAKTERFGTWYELEFRKDFLKQFSFSIVPEFRFQDQFKLDEYMIQGKLEYEPFSFLSVGGSYRVGTEVKDNDNLNDNRIAIDMQASHEVDRFKASLRARYTNSSNSQDDEQGKFIRPRVKLEYNIKGNKITPFATYELFHKISDQRLHKYRIDVGATRNIGDLHRIGLCYRLNNYFSDKNSIHIVAVEYRLKF